MPKYRVWMWYSAGDYVEVEAEDEEDAVDRVYDDGPSECGFDPTAVEWEWEVTEVEAA